MEEKKVEKISRSKPRSVKETQSTSKKQDELHYHYHSDPYGYNRGREQPSWQRQDRPGEVHYHYYYEPPRARKERSSKPGIAGGLLIINGVIQIIAVIFLIVAGSFIGGFGEGISFFDEETNGDISGTVTYINGTPVENARISIVGEVHSNTTDSDGNYYLLNVPTGNHKIKVEKEGYYTIIYKAFVSPSEFDVKEENGNIKIEPKTDNKDHDSDNDFDFVLTPGDGELERGSYPPFEWIQNILYVCAIVLIVISIFQFIGGINALRRKNYGLTIVCAVLGIFAILGIIALLILILSKNEFKKSENEVQQAVP